MVRYSHKDHTQPEIDSLLVEEADRIMHVAGDYIAIKITGWPDPLTPPPAKKDKRGAGAGEQKKMTERDSDSDFDHGAKKGGLHKLELHSSSQPVPYPIMSMFISRLT